jgi:RNA polymerase sigma-70 factor (ECF subfamily)
VPKNNQSTPQQINGWLNGVARRDADAFRLLYNATSPKLFGFALRILRKRELAEEALQESFVSIWHAAAGYQAHLAAPMTWMATIVRNKALDILRRTDDDVELDAQGPGSDMFNALQDGGPSPLEGLELGSDARALALCMSQLEGAQRQAIGMAFYHDLSHSEVSRAMEIPLGTVKTWIRRGLERLKACLTNRGAA